jgi:hypothetical protein
MKRAWQGMPQETMYKFFTCEFHRTNDLDEFYTDETSMATIATKENVNNHPCEFHQTNNLDKLFTDETSMIFFKYKYHKRICLKEYYARAKRFHSFSNF